LDPSLKDSTRAERKWEGDFDSHDRDRYVEIVKDSLAFCVGDSNVIFAMRSKLVKEGVSTHFITSPMHQDFGDEFSDFGPPNICIVFRFCTWLADRLSENGSRMLVYHIKPHDKEIINASLLLGSFLMLYEGYTALQTMECFIGLELPRRNITYLTGHCGLGLFNCLSAFDKAKGWLSVKNFPHINEKDKRDSASERISVINDKIIAFHGPLANQPQQPEEGDVIPPEHYLHSFHRLGVSCVVRLSEPDTYDKQLFERAGIRHHDLFFDHGTAPPGHLVEQFMAICSREERVAVHGRTGAGRAFAMAAVWLIRRCGFSAKEAVAWLRMSRPGSVSAVQMHYLAFVEHGWRSQELLAASSDSESTADLSSEPSSGALRRAGPPRNLGSAEAPSPSRHKSEVPERLLKPPAARETPRPQDPPRHPRAFSSSSPRAQGLAVRAPAAGTGGGGVRDRAAQSPSSPQAAAALGGSFTLGHSSPRPPPGARRPGGPRWFGDDAAHSQSFSEATSRGRALLAAAFPPSARASASPASSPRVGAAGLGSSPPRLRGSMRLPAFSQSFDAATLAAAASRPRPPDALRLRPPQPPPPPQVTLRNLEM
jgi:cell division cycle 14